MLYSEMTDKIINSAKNQISKEQSSPMKEGKYQKQKPQIRAYPRNPRHPRSIRPDEYYFPNP